MDAEAHYHALAEFVRGAELVGGTTPHVAMTVKAMERLPDVTEKIWFAGCYALAYNWPAAERLFLEWRPGEVDHLSFFIWLQDHRVGIPLRKERKAIFRQEFFTESATTYASFAKHLAAQDSWPTTYSAAFEMFDENTRYMGRYIGIRWMEVMRRAFALPWDMPDIAANGGQHPRKALALIYPEDAPALLGGNRPHEIAVSNHAADRLLLDLQLDYGITTTYYELQSLLCEYKQSALGRKQYPGKSIDTEMDYFRRVQEHWGDVESAFYSVRRACFPPWSLGEVSGWTGVRKELGGVLVDHGYTWSDAVYDWPATRDLAEPVLRAGGLCELLPRG
jgi:hypothetical protein